MGCTGSRDSEELYKFLKNKRVCIDKDTVDGTSLPLELEYAASTMRGWRAYNEDAYLIETSFSKTFHEDKVALFAVFDGHGGFEVSHFAREQIYTLLVRNAHFQRGKFDKALKQIFIQLDREMLSQAGVQKLQSIRKKQKNGNVNIGAVGSTVTVVLVTKTEIYVANLGDSKAVVLDERGKILHETVDHRPDHIDEKNRIHQNEGRIHHGRIDGDLNVSRGLGDFSHKDLNNPETSILSAIPDILIRPRAGVDCIILGSDGIWEQETTQTCKDVLQRVQQSRSMASAIEEHFNDLISKSPSSRAGMDNMTEIIIRFNQGAAI